MVKLHENDLFLLYAIIEILAYLILQIVPLRGLSHFRGPKAAPGGCL